MKVDQKYKMATIAYFKWLYSVILRFIELKLVVVQVRMTETHHSKLTAKANSKLQRATI